MIQRKAFSPCIAADAAVNKYRDESDTVRLFADEQGFEPTAETDMQYRHKLQDVYTKYRQYCLDDGYRPVSKGKLKKRLITIGFTIDKTNKGQTLFAKQTQQDEYPF